MLRGWIASRWSAGDSFIRWLNACAAEFESEHDGVYLEFTQVDEDAMRQMQSSGMRPPDLVFFSPGVMKNGSQLLPLDPSENLLPDLQKTTGRCFPVAMGGYIWAYNQSQCNAAPADAGLISACLPDENGRCFSAALVSLMSGEPSTSETSLPESGNDQGLPASTAIPIQDPNALEAFIDGKIPWLPVTQKEIARLVRLRDSGRGPDWNLDPTGNYALADQLLFCGAVDTGNPDRQEIAREFAAFLCKEKCQQSLADIAAIPVTSVPAYTAHSPYAKIAALMQTRRLLIPNPFSEYSNRDFGAIVRDFKNGLCDAPACLRRMGFPVEG